MKNNKYPYPPSAIIDINCLIQDLELVKRLIEWDYPITYQSKIDEVVEILQEVKDNDEI